VRAFAEQESCQTYSKGYVEELEQFYRREREDFKHKISSVERQLDQEREDYQAEVEVLKRQLSSVDRVVKAEVKANDNTKDQVQHMKIVKLESRVAELEQILFSETQKSATLLKELYEIKSINQA